MKTLALRAQAAPEPPAQKSCPRTVEVVMHQLCPPNTQPLRAIPIHLTANVGKVVILVPNGRSIARPVKKLGRFLVASKCVLNNTFPPKDLHILCHVDDEVHEDRVDGEVVPELWVALF